MFWKKFTEEPIFFGSVYLQVFAALHEIFHIVDGRKEEVQDLKELVLLFREPSVREELHQVAEVVSTARNTPEDISEPFSKTR